VLKFHVGFASAGLLAIASAASGQIAAPGAAAPVRADPGQPAAGTAYRQMDRPGADRKREARARAAAEYAGPWLPRRPSGASGCFQLVDEFDDGNADGWFTYSYLPGPSQALVRNGRYVLERAAGGEANPSQYFGVAWADSSDDLGTYYHGRMRLTFRVNEPGTTFLAFGRGFGAQFVVAHSWDGQCYLVINELGEGLFDYDGAYAPFDLQIGVDYRMEVSFVGADLSMKVWKASDPEPAQPQVQRTAAFWTDPNLREGDIGVEIDGYWQNGARAAEVDDISFCSAPVADPPAVDPATIPATGIPVPRLAIIDQLTRNYMAVTGAQSIVHSFMKDGKVQFHRAYGWADEAHTRLLQPDAMMRLASISKPFCAAAIRELVTDRKLKMSDHAFNLGQRGGGILNIQPFPSLGDPRYADMTLQNLIEHTSGWDRGAYGDIFWCDFAAARAMGLPMPISRADRLRFLLGTPLQYNPGTPGITDPYSNTAYEVLGLIVEQVSGMPYEQYVRQKVLPKIRVAPTETEIGRTFPQDFNTREPFYDPAGLSPNVFDQHGPWVRLPYGGWNEESYPSVASRIASNVALMGLASRRYLFGPNAGQELPEHLPRNFYDFHNGSFPGTDTDLLHITYSGGEVVTAIMVNHRASFGAELSIHPGAAFYFDYLLQGWADWPSRKSADMNCDGVVDVNDVGPFLLAVQDIDAYAAAYPNCTGFNGDMNGDLRVDTNDVAAFLQCVSRGGCP
jgi:CubicO group peptidase (beta-lactamase class C family)